MSAEGSLWRSPFRAAVAGRAAGRSRGRSPRGLRPSAGSENERGRARAVRARAVRDVEQSETSRYGRAAKPRATRGPRRADPQSPETASHPVNEQRVTACHAARRTGGGATRSSRPPDRGRCSKCWTWTLYRVNVQIERRPRVQIERRPRVQIERRPSEKREAIYAAAYASVRPSCSRKSC
jgi:hypothetical protein